jgi:hypothetical protein
VGGKKRKVARAVAGPGGQQWGEAEIGRAYAHLSRRCIEESQRAVNGPETPDTIPFLGSRRQEGSLELFDSLVR